MIPVTVGVVARGRLLERICKIQIIVVPLLKGDARHLLSRRIFKGLELLAPHIDAIAILTVECSILFAPHVVDL